MAVHERAELSGEGLVDWLRAAAAELGRTADEINRLNVFPVADADTGVNMTVTLAAALERARNHRRAATVAAAMVDGAVEAARGNSGVILSQILRGVGEAVRSHGALSGAAFAEGLDLAVTYVLAAIAKPVEGTIVSVLRAAAAGAREAAGVSVPGVSLAEVAPAAAHAAYEALLRTPGQLAENGDNGVVDAGGRGLLAVIDALVVTVTGAVVTRPRFTPGSSFISPSERTTLSSEHPGEYLGAAYEVMYLLVPIAASRFAPDAVETVRDLLTGIGDSVVVVADGDNGARTISVHVHTATPGKAVEVVLDIGKPRAIAISALGNAPSPDEPAFAVAATAGVPRVIVALVAGDQAAELFSSAGAHVIRTDGGNVRYRLPGVLAGFTGHEVLLLPNGALPTPDVLAIAAQARSAGVLVTPLPTGTVVQALAAIAVHDPEASGPDDTYSMVDAAAAARCGVVIVASEAALTIRGPVQPGDYLAMVNGEVVTTASTAAAATEQLADILLGTGGNMVTVLLGELAPEECCDGLAAALRATRPEVEVITYQGGQTVNVLEIGVE